MVCVAVKGVPVIGVIHKPFENVTAWGWVGPNIISHALRQNLEDSSRVELSKSRLIVSRSHAGGVHDVAGKLFGPEVQVTPAGGAGYKSWEVALGHQVKLLCFVLFDFTSLNLTPSNGS
jgi:inositol monophosphatase 3